MAADVSGDYPAAGEVKRISRGSVVSALQDALTDVLHVEDVRVRAEGEIPLGQDTAAATLLVEVGNALPLALLNFFAERAGDDGVRVEVVA